MADNFFCLDIGEKFTKIADAKLAGENIEMSQLGKIQTDPYFYSTDVEKNIESQAAIISKLIDSLKITKRNVNVVIPGALTYTQILTMPFLPEKELISAIKYQADQFIPMPIEETNIDLEVIEEFHAEKKILILIVAAPKRLIEKVQNTVEAAGLIPETIENELSASSRLVGVFGKKLTPPDQGGIIVANFGINSTNLSYYENTTFNLKESHSFAVGYQLFLKEIQVNTDSDAQKGHDILITYDAKNKSSYPVEVITAPLLKDFSSEIKRFAAGKKVSAIYIFNEIFLFPALSPFLTRELGIPTQELNPYAWTTKNVALDPYKNEMSLFVSSIGGNLR